MENFIFCAVKDSRQQVTESLKVTEDDTSD